MGIGGWYAVIYRAERYLGDLAGEPLTVLPVDQEMYSSLYPRFSVDGGGALRLLWGVSVWRPDKLGLLFWPGHRLMRYLALFWLALAFGCSSGGMGSPVHPSPAQANTVAQVQESAPTVIGPRSSVKGWYLWMLARAPKYVMDVKIKPDDPIEKGVDCSRLHYLCHTWAGLPYRRVTSYDIGMGLGGWSGRDVSVRDAVETDLTFWTWADKPNRPLGHTGALIVSEKSGLLEVIHASSSRGRTIQEPLAGKLERDLKKIRHLTY